MKESPKYTLPEQTRKLMEADRLKDCFTLLRRRLAETPSPRLLNKISHAENAYRFMLQYFEQGSADPGRESMIAGIRQDLLDTADSIDRETAAADAPEQYYSTLRMCRLRHTPTGEVADAIIRKSSMAGLAVTAGEYPAALFAEIEADESTLFNNIWTSDPVTAEDYRAITDAICRGSLPFSSASLCIAAAGLGLMRYYNRDAMAMLCNAAAAGDDKISARATATLMLALLRNADRVDMDSTMQERLKALVETDGMPRRLRQAAITAIRTRDTERISRKMQRDVIPGLMQFGPDILKQMKKTTEEASFADLDGNPEWERLLQESGLEEKLRELTELQSDGADVMMVAFSNLKGFPFFRQLQNWFLPFSAQHTSLRDIRGVDDEALSTMLEMNGMMCDSDKYSFAFSLASMPTAQRSAMMTQMKGHAEQLREQLQDSEILRRGNEFDNETTRYFRDLYRFHKLYAKRQEYPDPFALPMDFTSIPVVRDVLGVEDYAAPVGAFYFKRGYYRDALPLLQYEADSASDSPHIWEKIGFCHEKISDNTDKAIEAYMKAQLFNPDSKWISRRLGICFRRKGDYRNAADYLRMAMPDDGSFDRSLSLLLADTLTDAENWEEALKEVYRVDYETPGDPEVLRRIARLAFRLRRFDDAASRLASIPAISLGEEDYRLMGHVALLKGNFKDAIAQYRRTVRPNDDKRLWKAGILADAPVLESLGAAPSDIHLLMECLAYAIE